MAMYTLGPLIGEWFGWRLALLINDVSGPVVGPVMGGFVAQSIGIKWVFISAIINSSLSWISKIFDSYRLFVRFRFGSRNPTPSRNIRSCYPPSSRSCVGRS
jgi:MFS family permease